MSGSNERLAAALKTLRGVQLPNVVGEVTAVNEQKATCKVKLTSELELVNVRLKSVESSENKGVYSVPKTGSTVIIGFIDDQLVKPVILSVAEIKGDCSLVINNGFLIQKGNDTLGKCLDDLINELLKIQVVMGVTPNVPAITAIKERMNNILKTTD